MLRKRNQENHLALSPDLLGEFLRKLDAIDTSHEQTRIAMLLVVLTACRKAGVTGGKWSEIDRELNDHGYIVPGLGDAGDRIFGTKQQQRLHSAAQLS